MTKLWVWGLVAYVVARGDAKHPIFSGKSHDHSHNH